MTEKKMGRPPSTDRPRILDMLKTPGAFDKSVFESAMRNELESRASDELQAGDETLLAMLVMSMESLSNAHDVIRSEGYLLEYPAGMAMSPWLKIRTESLDKVVKLMVELSLTERTRPAKKPGLTAVDELFATA